MFRLFRQPELFDDNQRDKYSVHKLICLGLMLCTGEAALKARVFYDALQDNMQLKISGSDKDFAIIFNHFVVIACYMMLRFYREEASKPFVTQHYPRPGTHEFQETLENFREDYLDIIFGEESFLPRDEFLTLVT